MKATHATRPRLVVLCAGVTALTLIAAAAAGAAPRSDNGHTAPAAQLSSTSPAA